jgi:hypothetical protein
MTGNELRSHELSTVSEGLSDGLLEPQISGCDLNSKLQREADLLRDGLSTGFKERVEEAKEHPVVTSLEVAGSFAIGSSLAWMTKAGGKWGAAAKLAGGAFGVMMASDVLKRGTHTVNAMTETWNSELNMVHNKQVVAHYAGSALFDYPVMLGSGLAGAGAVHMAPRFAEIIKTREVGPTPGTLPLEMSLGDLGRLGAKERAVSTIDPLVDIRVTLTKPTQKTIQLGELSDVLEARRLAVHPDVAPIRGAMIETLGKIDKIHPEIASTRQKLTATEKHLTNELAARTEQRAVEVAEQHIESLRGDEAILAELRVAENRLHVELRKKPEGSTEPVRDPEVVREELSGIRQEIAATRARLDSLPQAELRLRQARETLAARTAAIEAGTDASVNQLTAQVEQLSQQLAGQESSLLTLTSELTALDGVFKTKAAEVTPRLDSDTMPGPLTDLLKPAAKVGLRETSAGTPNPGPAEVPSVKPSGKPEVVDRSQRAASKPEPKLESPQQERQSGKPERSVEQATERPAPTGERQVAEALQQAEKAVDYFARTKGRHTTAIKGITDYINRACEWFENDKAATARAGEILANVEKMLGKVENWQRAASWIPKGPDRAALMSKNGMSADRMAAFDTWAETMRSNYVAKPNQMAEMTLLDIQAHLQKRVQVESVKWYLKQAPDIAAKTSPIVQKGFDMMRAQEYPDKSPIHPDADLIVFERRTVRGVSGEPVEVVLPFARQDQYIQRFDARHIIKGMDKQQVMQQEGPGALAPEELYGFRLDHDPFRLVEAKQQVGFAILRPGSHGKHIAHMEFVPELPAELIPPGLRADVPGGPAGTNTGSLYTMLRKLTGKASGPSKSGADALRSSATRPSQTGLPSLEILQPRTP